MALSYTAESLVASLRRRALVPEAAAEGTLGTEDLVYMMSDEIQDYIIPEVLALREEFETRDYDFTTTPGVFSYAFPPRAVGPKLKEVLADRDGSGIYVPLQRIEPEDAGFIERSNSGSPPYCYYLKANSVVFPVDPGATLVRFQYFLRPNALILTEDAGLITDIDTLTGDVTLALAPTSFTSSAVYDFCQATPHFALLGMDLEASVLGDVLTFDPDDLPEDLAVGDYLTLAGESPIPQIPHSLFGLLAQRTAQSALESLGDSKAVVAEKKTEGMLRRGRTMLSPRVEERPRYLINKNGPGWRRRGW